MRKHLRVTCALVERDGRVLCTRRSASMSLPGKWEFPGGKIHDGETPEECLLRELREELGVDATVGRPLAPATHRYPGFDITLYPFLCTLPPGTEVTLHEHDRACWLLPEELPSLDWAEADVAVVEGYRRTLTGQS